MRLTKFSLRIPFISCALYSPPKVRLQFSRRYKLASEMIVSRVSILVFCYLWNITEVSKPALHFITIYCNFAQLTKDYYIHHCAAKVPRPTKKKTRLGRLLVWPWAEWPWFVSLHGQEFLSCHYCGQVVSEGHIFSYRMDKMGPALRHKASGVWNWMHIDTETWDGCEQWVPAAFPTFNRD